MTKKRKRSSNGFSKDGHGTKASLAKYAVEMVPIGKIKPSPENDQLYGNIDDDSQLVNLAKSIARRGLEEPLILSRDNFILSGHRRFAVVKEFGWEEVPCRICRDVSRKGNSEYYRELTEYNPQRVKSVGALLKEALLRDQPTVSARAAIRDYQGKARKKSANYMKVPGFKQVEEIGERRQEFLEAAIKVVDELMPYWPITIRTVHYNLLNHPPLRQTTKRSKYGPDHWRYRNDKESYNALVRLLGPARYLGHIPMDAIDDPTRPQILHHGFNSVDQFIQQEIRKFLRGFHRDRQDDQYYHIEILAEKNTLVTILRPVADEYYVPMSIGRGFCTIPVWRDMAERFEESGKDKMVLLIVSDRDPDGLELGKDAIRSLRDLWDIPIQGDHVAVTPEQIDELDLANDFNPAKVKSSRFKSFVEETGSTASWECEAIPPEYLADQFRSAIESHMDMDVFNEIVEQETLDINRISEVRESIASELEL